jgi:hypothetical protein
MAGPVLACVRVPPDKPLIREDMELWYRGGAVQRHTGYDFNVTTSSANFSMRPADEIRHPIATAEIVRKQRCRCRQPAPP